MKYTFKGLKGEFKLGEYTDNNHSEDMNVDNQVKDAGASFEIDELQVELEASEISEAFKLIQSLATKGFEYGEESRSARLKEREIQLEVERVRRGPVQN